MIETANGKRKEDGFNAIKFTGALLLHPGSLYTRGEINKAQIKKISPTGARTTKQALTIR